MLFLFGRIYEFLGGGKNGEHTKQVSNVYGCTNYRRILSKYGFRDKKPVHSYTLPSNADAAASDLSSKAQSVFRVQGHLPTGQGIGGKVIPGRRNFTCKGPSSQQAASTA